MSLSCIITAYCSCVTCHETFGKICNGTKKKFFLHKIHRDTCSTCLAQTRQVSTFTLVILPFPSQLSEYYNFGIILIEFDIKKKQKYVKTEMV